MFKGKEKSDKRRPILNLIGIVWMISSFVFVEVFMRQFIDSAQIWGVWMSLCWAVVFTAGLLLFPDKLCRILYAVAYVVSMGFAMGQIACHSILGHMIWVADVVHLGEGADYGGVITDTLSAGFWLWSAAMLAVGVIGVLLAPKFKRYGFRWAVCLVVILGTMTAKHYILKDCLNSEHWFYNPDRSVSIFRLTEYNYTIYGTLYDSESVYKVCGYYQLVEQDVIRHHIQPLLPSYRSQLEEKRAEADAFYAERPEHEDNEMTGIFEGKNVIMILLESMDDFLWDEDTTPNLNRLRSEGISFPNFYTPIYSSIHTFNTEFCAHNGYFLPTSGRSAMYYCENDFAQSMPWLFREKGYTAETYHYNDPSFYNRFVMHPAIGLEQYNYYWDYLEPGQDEKLLYDDCFMLKNKTLCDKMFAGDDPFYHYIITRCTHVPFNYDNPLSQWAFEKYPEYKGKYGSEELDCIYVKAKCCDDMIGLLMQKLEEYGHLDDTVIVAFTDHYAYGLNDEAKRQELAGVTNVYREMNTPCFIWAKDIEPLVCEKTLNTSDIVPTILNMFGMDSPYDYLGRDAFDPNYEGYVVFGDGSWLYNGLLVSEGVVLEELREGAAEDTDIAAMQNFVTRYLRTNDTMIETNYYLKQNAG